MNPVTNVIELADRFATAPECRQMASVLKVGAAIGEALETVLPGLTHNEQRILCTVVAFRLMGTMMPASPELFSHLPLTARMSEPELFAAAQNLVDGGVIDGPVVGDEMCFSWASLERLIFQAIQDADAPRILGPDGERVR